MEDGIRGDQSAPARRVARAILIDEAGCLLLVRRARPRRRTYWTAPGGGVESGDRSLRAALRRELAEELGATIVGATEVDVHAEPRAGDASVQHFFLARLANLDLALRDGPEFHDPSRGSYDLDRVDLSKDGRALELLDLRPAALKEFILADRENLLAAAAAMSS